MQDKDTEELKLDKVNVRNIPSTPHSINSTPTKSETETYSENRRFMSEASESEEDSVSEVESFIVEQDYDDESKDDDSKFLLNPEGHRIVDLETQAHIEELLQAAGISRPLTSTDSKALGDPDVLRQLTSSVSNALDEAAAALTRMRNDNAAAASNVQGCSNSGTYTTSGNEDASINSTAKMSLVEACSDGDVRTVRRLLKEGRSIHETNEDGEGLLSLTCGAGYFEIVEILLAMHAHVEDRGIKGDCTPLMEAATAGHYDIVKLLLHHGADVNAQSTSGSTPLIFACAAGHTEIVKCLIAKGANLEDHNENGHTPLMEAASAGHVGCAQALIENGAGINTHSSEFKESALTLACYKGHLEMVRYLLEAGADQEHKTDEMHTALMEASMDGHTEVARLLLDSGAQVNMPTESFESPLTLAACGGHQELAMLLIERGADIEEKNDEGYTPLMEASREGHDQIINLLLAQGANVNGTTEESQETALTLACSAGFIEIVEILIKNGADIELGSATPLMEASQDGHTEVVKFLLEYGANVNACTETGDTALALACENGHTEVVELLLQANADIEHESEGGRTPLMKACRAGNTETVEYLIKKGANVEKQTTNNDHTPLSLACGGGHIGIVELLLKHNANPKHKLKDNSTMLIEASRGGHTPVVQLLLDYPHSMVLGNQQHQQTTATTSLSMLPGQVNNPDTRLTTGVITPTGGPFFQPTTEVLATAVLQEVPEAVRIVEQIQINNPPIEVSHKLQSATQRTANNEQAQQQQKSNKKLLAKSRSTSAMFDGAITSPEVQQVRTPPLNDFEEDVISATAAMEYLNKEDPNSSLINFIKKGKTFSNEGDSEKQKKQILEELHRVERELRGIQQTPQSTLQQTITQNGQPHLYQYQLPHSDQCVPTGTTTALTPVLNFDLAIQQQKQGLNYAGVPHQSQTQIQVPFYAGTPLTSTTGQFTTQPSQSPACQATAPAAYYFTPMPSNSPQIGVSITAATTHTGTGVTAPTSPGLSTLVPPPSLTPQSIKFHSVADNTAINDRPKVKPIKKEAKNIRKQQALQQVPQQQQPSNINIQAIQTLSQNQTQIHGAQPKNFNNIFTDQQVQVFTPIQLALQAQQQTQQQSRNTQNQFAEQYQKIDCNISTEIVNMQDFDPTFLKDEQDSILTAAIIQQFNNPSFLRTNVVTPQKPRLEIYDPSQQDFHSQGAITKLHISDKDFIDEVEALQVQPYAATIDESVLASLTAAQQADLQATNVAVTSEGNRLEYYAVPAVPSAAPNGTTQVPVQTLFPYDGYIQGFQAGYSLKQQLLADSLTVAGTVSQPLTTQPLNCMPSNPNQPCVNIPQPQLIAACGHATQSSNICQSCVQHEQQQQQNIIAQQIFQQQPQQISNQVQAATQTQSSNDGKKQKSADVKVKKNRGGGRHANPMKNNSHDPNYQIDHNSAITQYNGANNRQCANSIPPLVELDCETESNHDTALTLACAGGHEELVELLINRGADIEHRDKKGFTPLILASSAGHDKVVNILLSHNADIEAQSERTKDTPLSLASSGGRYEVVELLIKKHANKEHRNVSDYTPLSLAASGGYVNIIRLLLTEGAEINSRTGSKLGISPLMLAAMNGHTAAVKMLLDMGSDINAQIETNRNTALTLACFQGRHEVVSLLLDRKANVEHRAKTGLTPLMEAASGGYVDVGKVLLEKGADVNATPVPSSRDTALTIASDKGHIRFVELLIQKGAQVEVKNKKGNSPMWLAANGGHLAVIELLFANGADIDSQDNRKVSCLMASFRRGHIKVVKWMVHHVTQFPNDQEMLRFISTVNDKELLEKCRECVKIIRAAKETQAARANENASILLEELESERTREESKRIAAAKKRERKKRKRLEKKVQHQKLLEEENQPEEEEEGNDKPEPDEKDEPEDNPTEEVNQVNNYKEEGDSGIDANSQGSCSSSEIKASKEKRKNRKNKKANATTKTENIPTTSNTTTKPKAGSSKVSEKSEGRDRSDKGKVIKESKGPTKVGSRKGNYNEKPKSANNEENTKSPADREDFEATGCEVYVNFAKASKKFDESHTQSQHSKTSTNFSPRQASKRDEGWKEVVRKSSVQPASDSVVKKVCVPLHAISRVIGRGGTNINAIRQHTGAVIEVEKQCKGQGERTITLKGSPEVTKQAFTLICTVVKDADADINSILSKIPKPPNTNTTLWDKTQNAAKKNVGKLTTASQLSNSTSLLHSKVSQPAVTSVIQSTVKYTNANTAKFRPTPSTVTTRVADPRSVEKRIQILQHHNIVRMPVSTATSNRPIKPITTTSSNQTFAAKFTDVLSSSQTPPTSSSSLIKSRSTLGTSSISNITSGPISPQAQTPTTAINIRNSPSKSIRPKPTGSAPPSMQLFQQNPPPVSKPQHSPQPSAFSNLIQSSQNVTSSTATTTSNDHLSTIIGTTTKMSQATIKSHIEETRPVVQTTSEYTLFHCQRNYWNRQEEPVKLPNFAAVAGSGSSQAAAAAAAVATQQKFIDQDPIPKVDERKAPGYRGVAVCSPVSSKTSSNSITPPNLSANHMPFQALQEPTKPQNILPPIGSRPQLPQQTNANDFMSFMDYNKPAAIPNLMNLSNEQHMLQNTFNPIPNLNFSQPPQQPQLNLQQQTAAANMPRLNVAKGPEYPNSLYNPMQNKMTNNMYNGYQMPNNMYSMKNTMDSNPYYSTTSINNNPTNTNPSHNRSWRVYTNNTDLIGLAGMTIHNLQKVYSGENLDTGSDLAGIVNNSSNLSTNLSNAQHGLHPDSAHFGLEERKPPQPIGTERARKSYNSQIDQNWSLNDKQSKWGSNTLEYGGGGGGGSSVVGGGSGGRSDGSNSGVSSSVTSGSSGLRPTNLYQEEPPLDFTRQPIMMDNYISNQGNFFHHNAPPLSNLRHDFMQDMPKWDLPSCDNSRSINDLQDKQQHVSRYKIQSKQVPYETGWTNQWHK